MKYIVAIEKFLLYVYRPFSEMGEHLIKHGDGVKDVAFTVEDCDYLVQVIQLKIQVSLEQKTTNERQLFTNAALLS